MVAEKTSKPAVTQHQSAGGTFFRKAAEEGFFGNRETPSFFGAAIQPKLTVSQPDDPQEREADAVADQVMRMPEPAGAAAGIQRQENATDGAQQKLLRMEEERDDDTMPLQPTIMRKCAGCEREDHSQAKLMRSRKEASADNSLSAGITDMMPGGNHLHPKAHAPPAGGLIQRSGRAPPAPDTSFESALQGSKGGGSSLPDDTRRSMENRFGSDFGDVRIHTGTQAESLSSDIHAQAFAHGNDIYFNSGKFSPDTAEGSRLLAHELTHTIQQGASKPAPAANDSGSAVAPKVQRATLNRKPQTSYLQRVAGASGGKTGASAFPPKQVSALTGGIFNPSEEVAEYVAAGKYGGKEINVSFGSLASGKIKVRKRKDAFETISDDQAIPLQLPFLQPLAGAGLQPVLAVNISNNKITGYVTTGLGKSLRAGSRNGVVDWIRKNPALMKWTGLDNLSKGNIINQIDGDKLRLEIKDIKVRLGGFVTGSLNIGLVNSAVIVSGNADVTIKNLTTGNLVFSRDEAGDLRGTFTMRTQLKNFTGSVTGAFLNGIFDIHGKAAYATEKLRGEINFIVTDAKKAKSIVLQQMEPQQISEEAAAQAGLNEPDAGPQPGPRAIAGWGVLDFSFNSWLTGSAKVIVDSEGYVTVHGEITPPAVVTLFRPKPYRSDNFIDIHPTFRWGIPHIADVHIGLDFVLYAEAQIGPAVLKDIKIIGNYSTDPLLFNDFRIEGTFNLMGYAALVFSFGAHAGVSILGFDIDLGGKLNAKAGIKGYVEARPVIGYREKADPVAGKKGEFFIKGEAELAAQPFLGLEGIITLFVDSPWPIPNYPKEWPMWKKEYPLPGEFGIGITFGEYVLGSGEWPDIEWGKVKFDPDKFADDLLEDNVPEKQTRNQEPKKGFADKLKGTEVTPPAPAPAPVPTTKPAADKKSKKDKEKPPTKDVLTRWQGGTKALKALKDKRDQTPVAGEQLQAELKSIRRKYNFTQLTATHSGVNWAVYAEMPGINNATSLIGIKGIAEPEHKDENKEAAGPADSHATITAAEWNKRVLKLQQPFATPDKAAHRIYFALRGNVLRLMLNPVPAGDYEQKIGEVNIPAAPNDRVALTAVIHVPMKRNGTQVGVATVNPGGDGKVSMTALKTAALQVAAHLDGLIRSGKSTRTDATTEIQDQTPDFTASLQGLASITAHLFSAEAGGPLPVTGHPAYGGLVNGFGKRMDVKPLTKLGVPGTGVSITSPDYEALLLRRETAGGRSYYIAGHLLNNNVHGSGTTWENLTPIAQRTNGRHESAVESKVKEAVEKGLILHYTVDVDYAIPRADRLINSIEAIAAWQSNSVLNEKHKILVAEAKLPTRLNCTVRQIKADGTDLPATDPAYNAQYNISGAAGIIENTPNVAQDSLDSYYLTDASAVTYKDLPTLTTEAGMMIATKPGATWNEYYTNPSYKVSIDNLSRADQESLRNIFRKKDIITEERERIAGLMDMQTWAGFTAGRVAYAGGLLSDNDKNALHTRFAERMRILKGFFLQTLTRYVNGNLADPKTLWGDFRRVQELVPRTYEYPVGSGIQHTILSETDIQDFKTTVFDPRIKQLKAAAAALPVTPTA